MNQRLDAGLSIGAVGVIGKDFLESDIERLESQGMDLSGVERSDDLTSVGSLVMVLILGM